MVDLEFVGDYRQPQLTARQRELGFDGQSDGDFSFDDFLDIINPLQHIPILSTLYREITGDQIAAPARILGGALFGGPTGFLAAAANSLYEEIAGEDIGETVVALFTSDSDAEPQFAEGDGAVAPATAGLQDPAAPVAAADLDALLAPPLTTAAGAAPAIAPPAAPPLPVPRHAMAPEPSHGMAPAGAQSPGMLTGQDALNALFRDLGGGQPPQAPISQAPAPQPLAPQPLAAHPLAAAAAAAGPQASALPGRQAQAAKSIPLPPRMIRVAPATPQTVPSAAQDVPDAAVAARMMEALDKYRAMSQQRQATPQQDEVQWRGDPALPDSGS